VRLPRLESLPIALIAAVLACAAFGATFLIGWATAGTHEHLNQAEPEDAPREPAALVVLGRAAALPAAPPKRRGAAAPVVPIPRAAPGSGGKLLSGTG
jgi:hypothetical protein